MCVSIYIYIYNSVCACRHIHINSFVSVPLNATKIAVMKCIHWRTAVVGPEFLFSIYKCWKFCTKWPHVARVIEGPSLYTVLEAEQLLSRAFTWHHSTKWVFGEPLRCVGSGTA